MGTNSSDSDDSDSDSNKNNQLVSMLQNYKNEILINITHENKKVGYIKGVL